MNCFYFSILIIKLIDICFVQHVFSNSHAQMQNILLLKGWKLEKIRLCLVTVFIFYFQKLVFRNIKKKKFLVFLKSKTCLVS